MLDTGVIIYISNDEYLFKIYEKIYELNSEFEAVRMKKDTLVIE